MNVEKEFNGQEMKIGISLVIELVVFGNGDREVSQAAGRSFSFNFWHLYGSQFMAWANR